MLISQLAVTSLPGILTITLQIPAYHQNNKTSAAILTGKETTEELALLADDIHLFLGWVAGT